MKQGYRIGELARFFGISPDLIRHYEGLGLVTPSAVLGNRYRQYSFKDAIKLNYVRVLRDLEFQLDDIAVFLEESDLEAQKGMLLERSLAVEERIAELCRLRDDLKLYYHAINEAQNGLNRFVLGPSPAILYHEPDVAGDDPFMALSKESFAADPGLSGGNYCILVDQAVFNGEELAGHTRPACSWVVPPDGSEDLPPDIRRFSWPRCLLTVVKSRITLSDTDIAPILEHMKMLGLKAAGDALGDYLAFERTEEGFIDYVAVWVPLA